MSSASEPTETVIIENIETGISEYYKLKAVYESKIADVKNNFLTNYGSSKISLPEKRARLDVLRNSVKCVNCRQPGGMTFSNVNGELRIVCKAVRPCMNKIIKKPKYHNMETLMYDAQRDVYMLKERTIQLKLDLLFNYASEEDTVAEFGQLQRQISSAFEKYDEIRSRYYDIVQNLDRAKKMHEIDVEIQTEIQNIKSALAISSSVSAIEQSVVADTVNRAYETMTPLLKRYSEMRFMYSDVIPDYDNEQHSRLVQKYISLKNLVQPVLSTLSAPSSSTSSIRVRR